MKPTLLRLSYAGLMLASMLASAAAQTRSNDTQLRPSSQTAPEATQSSADEDFELNIGERRITRDDYEASVSVAVGEEGARGLNLRVGVAVGASQIDVLLRNVRGRVRFRATLEQVLRRLNERHAGGAVNIGETAPPNSPSP